MKKCVVKNIDIYYDEEQENKIDYIKMVLENNFELLSRTFGDVSKIGLVPIEDSGYYYIENFDSFFENVVNEGFNADLMSLFTDIKKYVKHGVVTKEEKVQMWRQIFDSMQETKEKIASIAIEAGVDATDLSFLDKPKIDIESCVDSECDELIDGFVKHGFLVINGYQYIFGTFIAIELLKKCNNDPSIVGKMIKFIDEPGNMNLQDLVNVFEMHDLFEKTDKGVSKIRKLN